MFWKVRPIPAWTMSFGRALRKMPTRASRRWYQAGRAIADEEHQDQRRARVTAAPMKPTVSSLAWLTDDRADDADDDRRRDPQEGLEPGPDRAGDHRPAADGDPPGGRVVDPGDDVEERRLAGAVRADQADDRALGDVEADVVDGDEAAEPLRDVLGAEQDRALRRRWRGRRLHPAHRSLERGRRPAVGDLRARPGRRRACAAPRLPSLAREQALRPEQHHQRPGRCRTAGTGTGRS